MVGVGVVVVGTGGAPRTYTGCTLLAIGAGAAGAALGFGRPAGAELAFGFNVAFKVLRASASDLGAEAIDPRGRGGIFAFAVRAWRASPNLRRPSATAARASVGSGRSPPAGHQRISAGALAPACLVRVGKRLGFTAGALGPGLSLAGARFGGGGFSDGSCPAVRRGGRRPSVRGGKAGARLPAEPIVAPQASCCVLLRSKHGRVVTNEPLEAVGDASSA